MSQEKRAGFKCCDEHSAGILVIHDEKTCPVCDKITDMKIEMAGIAQDLMEEKLTSNDLLIERDKYYNELMKAKADIAKLIIEKKTAKQKADKLPF